VTCPLLVIGKVAGASMTRLMLSYLVRLVGAPRVRLRRAAQTTIARMPAAHSACRPSCERNGDLGVLSAPISELSLS
jgi:hypothetical protein